MAAHERQNKSIYSTELKSIKIPRLSCCARWAVDFFRECVAMGAHSLYIKDPSGVLTPEMAACVSRQVKEAYPDLPLVIHTHYQTGYGYMTYLEAVKNGANGVECSLGFPDGAGQPYGLTMLRAFEDLGFNTGDPDKKAMAEVIVRAVGVVVQFEH